jgi:hypothetical protein
LRSHSKNFAAAPWPASSASKARTMRRAKVRNEATWRSVSAVPHVATAWGTPTEARPITSV